MCAVSIQYLTAPLVVFREVRRVAEAGRAFIVSFSNRCFPTKAVAVWLAPPHPQHVLSSAPTSRAPRLGGT